MKDFRGKTREDQLSALDKVANEIGAKPPNRLAWRIDWQRRESGRVYNIKVKPVVQLPRADGWSSGKHVALWKSDSEPDARITEQDRTIKDSIGYGTDFIISKGCVLRTLYCLAGHPFLFRMDSDDRVEIRHEDPVLSVTESGAAHLIKLQPYLDPNEMLYGDAVIEDAGGNLRVVSFCDMQKEIASILGSDGLSVPKGELNTVMQIMGKIASVVTVNSDVSGIETGLKIVQADTRLYIQIQPYGCGLEVEAVTRPLGEGTNSYSPGVGSSSIFGVRSARPVRSKRFLERETQALSGFISSCKALSETNQIAENRWRLNDESLALEFLLQLQELGELVVAEWPKGSAWIVKRLDSSQINLSVRGTDYWFSLSGEFPIDENLVIDLKKMLELLALSTGRFVPIGKKSFVALTEEFKKRLDDLSVMCEEREDELRLHPLAAVVLEPISKEVGSFKGDVWEAKIRAIKESERMNFALPSSFNGELREYQTEGYKWLMRLSHWGAGGCLADDMGLGKTIQALAVLLERASGGPALVVAPTSVCLNWIAEASKFAPTLRVTELRSGDREAMVRSAGPRDVLVTTYGLMQNEQESLSSIRWHTIVLDEAQAIKNMWTKRSKAAMKLEADFKMATTGTPIENNLFELWNLFHFINPDYLGSLESFKEKFVAPIERDEDSAVNKCLKQLISPFILRRQKISVLSELPPKTEMTLKIELMKGEREVYEAIRRNALEEIGSQDSQDKIHFVVFAQLMKLRLACCHSSLVKDSPIICKSAKLKAFSELMYEIKSGGHKVLVFSQFVKHLAILKKRLDQMKINYQYLDGSTSSQERARRVAAFQSGEGDCFLISLKAGGTGLNLTAADSVIHMDPWWNPAVEEQASDRAHRIGQERPVTVYRIVAKGTIEEKIIDLHAYKKNLADSLLDESSTPDRFSAEDLKYLIEMIRT